MVIYNNFYAGLKNYFRAIQIQIIEIPFGGTSHEKNAKV